jgi:hypothetical protein
VINIEGIIVTSRFYRLAFCLFLIGFAGCVSNHLDDAGLKRLGNVAVASILGDTLHGVYIGTTAFNNEAFQADVSGWNIDPMTATYMQKQLTDAGLQTFLLTVPAGSRESLYREDGIVNYPALSAVAAAQHADTVIVVARARGTQPIPPGYGLFVRGLFGLQQKYVYAELLVAVVDVKTQKILALHFDSPVEGPPSKEFEWKSPFEAYSPAEAQKLRALVEDRIRTDVREQLVALNLVHSG